MLAMLTFLIQLAALGKMYSERLKDEGKSYNFCKERSQDTINISNESTAVDFSASAVWTETIILFTISQAKSFGQH